MHRFRDQAGDTLVEVLVALAVLSIGIVALVGALTTNITMTVTNRDQSQAESVLASAAEHVKSLSLPFSCSGGTPTAVATSAVPRSDSYAVTYGPAEALAGQPCAKLIAVPVVVTGNGFALTVRVVKRP